MKRKQEKELQLPCCASTHSTTAPSSCLTCFAPLVPLVPRASRARTSRQRAPLDTCTSRPTCASRPRLLSTLFRLHSRAGFSSTSRQTRAFLTLRLPRALFCTSAPQHVLSALRLALFWARCNRVHQSGADTPPFPPAFPRFGNRQMRKMRFCCYASETGR